MSTTGKDIDKHMFTFCERSFTRGYIHVFSIIRNQPKALVVKALLIFATFQYQKFLNKFLDWEVVNRYVRKKEYKVSFKKE